MSFKYLQGWRLTPLMAGYQLDVTPSATALWPWPSSQIFTQQRVHSSKPRAASSYGRVLWDTVSKALLKSRRTTPTAFPNSLSGSYHRSGESSRTCLLETQAGWTYYPISSPPIHVCTHSWAIANVRDSLGLKVYPSLGLWRPLRVGGRPGCTFLGPGTGKAASLNMGVRTSPSKGNQGQTHTQDDQKRLKNIMEDNNKSSLWLTGLKLFRHHSTITLFKIFAELGKSLAERLSPE